MSRMASSILHLLVAALIVGACGRTSTPATANLAPVAVAAGTMVVVDNHNFADVEVFVVRDREVSMRLGMVNGASAAKFDVDPSLFPTGTIALVARPIGARGEARSGPLVVSAGQTVTFTIEPDLRASMATVR